MKSLQDMIEMCRVPHGKKVRLADHDPAWAGDKRVSKVKRKELAKKTLTEDVAALAAAQQLLYASDTWSVLVIFQAMDAAGKDGTIKHVMSGVNPQGCQVHSFKHPSPEELDHDFLWRSTRVLPERGRIGIFNRSYYEEALIVRVHPKLVESQRIPNAKVDKKFWKERYESINCVEQHLSRNGTKILKFFLNVSKDEQARRFLERVRDPRKHWKFSAADLAERKYWDDYMHAYEACLNATSSKEAPWYIIPADHKWVSRALVASIITQTIQSLDLQYPQVTRENQQRIKAAGVQLEKELGKKKD